MRHTEHLFERREDDTRLSCEFRFEVVHSPTVPVGRGWQRREREKKEGERRERKERKKGEKKEGRRKRNEKRVERWAGTDGRGEKKKRELLEQ